MEKIAERLYADCIRADEVNLNNLLTVLSDNKDTEYGKKYGFADITTPEEYRKKVPAVLYDDIRPYVERMMNGEENVLTVYPTHRYCSTSGTTGAAKYIPMSDNDLDRKGLLTEEPKNLFLSSRDGKRLMVSTFRTYSEVPGKQVFLLSEMYYKYIYDAGIFDVNEYVGGEALFFIPQECGDMMYAKSAAALACDDLRTIECMFMYEILNFFVYIEKNWRRIVDDLRKRKLPEDLSLTDEAKDYLMSMNVTEERLRKIENECSKGFAGIGKRLWERLEFVNGIGNKSFLTEDNAITGYLGDVPKQYYCYSCSESLIGVPTRMNENRYVMVLRTGYFEFLPYMAEPDGVTYQPHELKIGELYEPIITNFSGLYRYRLTDVITVKGFIGKSPVIEFMFRKGQALNISGEKVDMRQLEEAVYSLRNYGLDIEKYSIGVVLEDIPGRYFAVLAVRGELSETGISDEKASELLDNALKKCSPDFRDLRGLGQIAPPEVMLCESSVFEKFVSITGSEKSRTHGKAMHIYNEEVPKEKWRQTILELRKQKKD